MQSSRRLTLAFLLTVLAACVSLSSGEELKPRDYHFAPDYVVHELAFLNGSSLGKKSSLAIPAGGNVVELLIVCDREWGDLFNHDRKQILEYWTTFMWDVNLRYKTMPNVEISFIVVDVLVMATAEEQPFIEDSRASDGRANLNRILENFSDWIYAQKEEGRVATHDMAIVITNAAQEWCCGLAWMSCACYSNDESKRSYNTAAFVDRGEWSLVNTAAHELGHNLGGPHDDDPGFPGGCSEKVGYVMDGSTDDRRFFFSICSDRTIGAYVGTEQADCLRRTDNLNTPVINPSFNSPEAPDMTEQCRRLTKDPEAYVEPEHQSNCTTSQCVYHKDDELLLRNFPPMDNSICGDNKRCFRGRCREHGVLLKNGGRSLCLQAVNQFSSSGYLQLAECPAVGTASDRFVLRNGTHGVTLASPFLEIMDDGSRKTGDKCIYTLNNGAEATVAASACNDSDPFQGWELVKIWTGQVVIQHKLTGRCIKPGQGNNVYGYNENECLVTDPDVLWDIIQ